MSHMEFVERFLLVLRNFFRFELEWLSLHPKQSFVFKCVRVSTLVLFLTPGRLLVLPLPTTFLLIVPFIAPFIPNLVMYGSPWVLSFVVWYEMLLFNGFSMFFATRFSSALRKTVDKAFGTVHLRESFVGDYGAKHAQLYSLFFFTLLLVLVCYTIELDATKWAMFNANLEACVEARNADPTITFYTHYLNAEEELVWLRKGFIYRFYEASTPREIYDVFKSFKW